MENNVIEISSRNKFRGIKGTSLKGYDIINTGELESAATLNRGEGGNSMDETLFDELKKDIREREERTRREISEREQRFIATIDKYTQEAKERELRYREDSKEREERITQIAQNIEERTNETTKHMENMKNQNFWGNIALFAGMLAIIITLIAVI